MAGRLQAATPFPGAPPPMLVLLRVRVGLREEDYSR